MAEALGSDSESTLPMAQIDLLLAAELVVVLLLMATMDSQPPQATEAQPPLDEPVPPVGWTAETDLHAQRILRLERQRAESTHTVT